jgi:CRP/FNR family nitrogen fixation transcriptional regulator
MLIWTNARSHAPVDAHLAGLVGDQTVCSEFKYCKGKEIFGERGGRVRLPNHFWSSADL